MNDPEAKGDLAMTIHWTCTRESLPPGDETFETSTLNVTLTSPGLGDQMWRIWRPMLGRCHGGQCVVVRLWRDGECVGAWVSGDPVYPDGAVAKLHELRREEEL